MFRIGRLGHFEQIGGVANRVLKLDQGRALGLPRLFDRLGP